MLKVQDFTLPEITFILENANFTKDEKELFKLRNKEKTLEECAEIMNTSLSTICRINKKMKTKILKLL